MDAVLLDLAQEAFDLLVGFRIVKGDERIVDIAQQQPDPSFFQPVDIYIFKIAYIVVGSE
jgi:hypothetical protein